MLQDHHQEGISNMLFVGNDGSASKSSYRPSTAKIEVISETIHPSHDEAMDGKYDQDKVDDFDDPPPLFALHHHVCKNEKQTTEGPSLMEQMMGEGLKASIDEKKKKIKAERIESKKKTSFSTLKKGFLSNTGKSTSQKANNFEGEGVPIPLTRQEINTKESTVTVVTARKTTPQSSSYHHPLHLSEVQDALNEQTDAFTKFFSDSSKWATTDLMEKISTNPRIIAGMSNPKFTAALQALVQNPRKAMLAFKDSDADIVDYIREFCSILGEHFTKLGEEQEASHTEMTQFLSKTAPQTFLTTTNKSSNANSTTCQGQRARKIGLGPLVEDVLHRQKEITRDSQEMSQEERTRINQILHDQSLKEILMDIDMQNVIRECSSYPGRMRMYMQHDVYGPRLRRMIDAGLLQVR